MEGGDNRPFDRVALLHACGLIHGPYPAVQVLLSVGAEEVRSHPAVFRLRANHRVLIVNVGAHSCVAGLREIERGGERGGERGECV